MSATTSTITSKASEWLENYPLPWYVDPGRVSHTVRDSDGAPIVCLPPFEWDRSVPMEVQNKAAQLIALVPEILHNWLQLLDIMRRTDREFTNSLDVPLATDEEWDAALDDAQALFDLLGDEGVIASVLESAPSVIEGEAP